jgi:signal transduction histidine kinase
MRRRLLVSTLTIALIAVVTLGVPLLLLARHEVWSSARDTLRQQTASVAAGLEDRLDAGLPVNLARYVAALHDRRIIVHPRKGPIVVGGPLLRGPLLEATVNVSDSTVTVQTAQHPVASRARNVTLLVVGLLVLAVGTAVALAIGQARRLTAPLSELLRRSEALGRGDFAPAPVASGIVEIDGISRVLEHSAAQIKTMIDQQRNFASDAAHQLRTPLTGIGLRLEELSRIGNADVRTEAESALGQVERLARVISVLLARAKGDAEDPTVFDLGRLIDHESAGWAHALAESHRELTTRLEPGLVVRARREHVAGVLSCLLDNALQHGDGRVTLTGSRSGDHINLDVADEGPGVPSRLAPHIFDRRVSGSRGTGIGLALARSLAVAEGGRLDLLSSGRSTFRFALPSEGPAAG